MAKKINFKTIDEVKRAHGALLDFNVEHVLVCYPANPKEDKPEKQYIVVLNRLKNDALMVLQEAKLSPICIKNARHYERIAANHKHFKG